MKLEGEGRCDSGWNSRHLGDGEKEKKYVSGEMKKLRNGDALVSEGGQTSAVWHYTVLFWKKSRWGKRRLRKNAE